MITRSASIGHGFAVLAILSAAIGGAYIGLFSCGGYVWRERVILVAIAVFTIAAIILAARTRIWRTALIFSLGVILTYRVFIGIAWPFYLGPTSVGDYLSEFSHAFLFGPC
jgi:sorbitol-specific phosphotransferase system component IIC